MNRYAVLTLSTNALCHLALLGLRIAARVTVPAACRPGMKTPSVRHTNGGGERHEGKIQVRLRPQKAHRERGKNRLDLGPAKRPGCALRCAGKLYRCPGCRSASCAGCRRPIRPSLCHAPPGFRRRVVFVSALSRMSQQPVTMAVILCYNEK